MRKLKATVLTSIILLSFGITHPSSIKADEGGPSLTIQDDMSEQKAPTTDQSIADFTDQINQSVDITEKIKNIFPDPVLAQAVADSLSTDGTVDGYIDTTKSNYLDNSVDLEVLELVTDWTGMSVFKNKIGGVNVVNQGKNFNKKALTLLKMVANKDKLYKVSFIGDGITDETFNDFIEYFNDTLNDGINLSMDSNYIHDLRPLTNYKYNGDHIFINNQFGAGTADKYLTVKDNKITINNDELNNYRQMPTGQTSSYIITKSQMFDTDNSRSVYEYSSETRKFLKKGEIAPTPIYEVDHSQVTTQNVEDYFNNLVAHNINIQDPFWGNYGEIHHDGMVVDDYGVFVSSNMITQEDADYVNTTFGTNIKMENISTEVNNDTTTISNIPKNASSITLRTNYAVMASYAGGYGNTIDIPIKHESEQTSSSSPNTPTDHSSSSTPTSVANSTSSTDHSASAQTPTLSDGSAAGKNGQAVYATKKVGLYKKVNFTKKNRKHFYAKQPRTKRPQFVVTGYARTKAGTLRYRVRDVNHTRKTDRWTGYLTANPKYVTNTYYRVNPKRIKVINRRGINTYRKINLSGKLVKHYQRGTMLKVKRIKAHHLTTRLQLSNGTWITANKTLVIKK
ncbi:MAG: DUF5776 domain-containing protein [Levilactobacillus sp.]|jgi:hypothetical protein|uniref:DUF5776 domain-containing protein n=1 Tax=Levilactobacillus sp. TaxID=2767919 RepID=UPI002586173E|nr:DUF5776 domain-containing protein [Levilactobacillus sp.]MCH4123417.1 DUF5776 domain-containing protein [Levilactobacillus sp.]MCI1552445.1 DUF5776 domain-containing protein [Levilactobacillus sp.]MCI1599032.1 DUF5776 domain-containing protein [Levilactobacillus sp.]